MTLVAAGTQISRVKTGRLMFFAGWRLPAWDGFIEVLPGWIYCNAGVVPNSGRFSPLAVMLGTRFGGTFGQTPDCRDGKVPVPKGPTNFPSVGQVIGEINHTLSWTEQPPHTHTYLDKEDPSVPWGPGGQNTNRANNDLYDPWDHNQYGVWRGTGNAGGGGAHNNMPWYFTTGPVLVHL